MSTGDPISAEALKLSGLVHTIVHGKKLELQKVMPPRELYEGLNKNAFITGHAAKVTLP